MERGMREIEGTRCREGYLEESSRTNRKFKKIIIKKPIRRREKRTTLYTACPNREPVS